MIKKGLHLYFERHSWKNTTLLDFIGCLNEAFESSQNNSMGPDFRFKDWSDTWLFTSGINIPSSLRSWRVEYNADDSIKKLSIQQNAI